MKVSADWTHPYYDPNLNVSAMQVYMNGRPINDCLTIDTEERWALQYIRNDKGQMLIHKESGHPYLQKIEGDFTVLFTASNLRPTLKI
jgi:hypothetical protein